MCRAVYGLFFTFKKNVAFIIYFVLKSSSLENCNQPMTYVWPNKITDSWYSNPAETSSGSLHVADMAVCFLLIVEVSQFLSNHTLLCV